MQQLNSTINYLEHALDILEHALTLAGNGERFALVTSLSIEGGAARSVGSLAVISETGQMTGYLSNGCVDRDIILQSLQALEEGRIKQVRYGEGSQYFDIRLPCGGALEIVIDPNADINILANAAKALHARQSVALNFSPTQGLLASQNQGAKTIIYAPKPILLLAGRGAIMLKTAELAAEMDFDLHIASPDEDDLAILAQLAPTKTHRMTQSNTPLALDIDAHTAVMLLFHDHEWEQALLMHAARQDPFFIGAMGSRKTQALRLADLKEHGLEDEARSKIRGPIGLVPSLRNASMIAVSALAEVIAALPAQQYESEQ